LPESLVKYVSTETAEKILNTSSLRWSSLELFDEPWASKQDPKLDFDHLTINEAMLKFAVSMIFSRDMPSGNTNHPLYKAIRRWRSEERFKDEMEAFDALKELLAPTPETLAAKLKKIASTWRQLIEHSRIICLSETSKDPLSWQLYADNHRGMALKFSTDGALSNSKPVVYTGIRTLLTSVKQQVDDLVGIKRADVIDTFENRLLSRPKISASEKEWRNIKVFQEDELDCGEDAEDWFLDLSFEPKELKAVYFSFKMPDKKIKALSELLNASYPSAILYRSIPVEGQYEVDFEKL
jgi:hypothetical protein